MSENITITIRGIDAASPAVRTAISNLQRLGGNIKSTGGSVAAAGLSFGKMAGAIGGATAAIAAITGGVRLAKDAFVGAVKAGAEFNQVMARVQSLTGASPEQFTALEEQIRSLGRTTNFSATEAAEGAAFLAQAGFDVQKTIAALPDTLKIAQASQLDLASTADIVSNIMAGFGVQADELGRVGDVLTQGFTSSNVSLSQLGETMKFAAPNAAEAKISIEELTAAAGILGNAGLQATLAGTSLRSVFQRLLAPTNAARKEMKKWGIEVVNGDGTLKSLTKILREFEVGLANATDEQRAQAISTIINKTASSGFLALLRTGSGTLKTFTEQLENSKGRLDSISEIMTGTLDAAFRRADANFNELQIDLTKGIEPALKSLIDNGLIPMTQGFAEMIPVIVQAFNAIAGPLETILPKIPKLVQGFIDFLGFLRDINDTLFGIPGRVAAIISGFAAFSLVVDLFSAFLDKMEDIRIEFLRLRTIGGIVLSTIADAFGAILDRDFTKAVNVIKEGFQQISETNLNTTLLKDLNTLQTDFGTPGGLVKILPDPEVQDAKNKELKEKLAAAAEDIKQSGIISEPIAEALKPSPQAIRGVRDNIEQNLANVPPIKPPRMEPIPPPSPEEIEAFFGPIEQRVVEFQVGVRDGFNAFRESLGTFQENITESTTSILKNTQNAFEGGLRNLIFGNANDDDFGARFKQVGLTMRDEFIEGFKTEFTDILSKAITRGAISIGESIASGALGTETDNIGKELGGKIRKSLGSALGGEGAVGGLTDSIKGLVGDFNENFEFDGFGKNLAASFGVGLAAVGVAQAFGSDVGTQIGAGIGGVIGNIIAPGIGGILGSLGGGLIGKLFGGDGVSEEQVSRSQRQLQAVLAQTGGITGLIEQAGGQENVRGFLEQGGFQDVVKGFTEFDFLVEPLRNLLIASGETARDAARIVRAFGIGRAGLDKSEEEIAANAAAQAAAAAITEEKRAEGEIERQNLEEQARQDFLDNPNAIDPEVAAALAERAAMDAALAGFGGGGGGGGGGGDGSAKIIVNNNFTINGNGDAEIQRIIEDQIPQIGDTIAEVISTKSRFNTLNIEGSAIRSTTSTTATGSGEVDDGF